MEHTLWPACVKVHGFQAQLQAAAAAGFDAIAIGRLTYRQLLRDGCSAPEIRRMADDQGIALGHYDGFAQWAPYPFAEGTPPAARDVFADSPEQCLQMCEELGLPAICATGVFDPAVVERPRLIDAFGEFCDQAANRGVRVDLECIPMWGVPDLATAWTLVDGAGCSNASVLLDSWHFFRGCADLELLRAMPSESIRTVQLADAVDPPAGRSVLEDCLGFRLMPGEGNFPLQEFLEILAAKGGVSNIGPEVFSHQLDDMEAGEAALKCAKATREALLASGINVFNPVV